MARQIDPDAQHQNGGLLPQCLGLQENAGDLGETDLRGGLLRGFSVLGQMLGGVGAAGAFGADAHRRAARVKKAWRCSAA